MSYTKTFAMIFGWVYVAVGVIGFLITGFDGFFATEGEQLLFFEVNPLHNLVHVAIGAAYIMGSRSTDAGARAVVVTLSVAYLLVGVLGLILIDTDANILAINQADNGLHFVTGILGLVIVALDSRRRTTPTQA